MIQQYEILLDSHGRGLTAITKQVLTAITEPLPKAGLINCFIPHTSASLVIQENADPSARYDLEQFIGRLVPDGQNWHRHTDEGDDDSSSHMKSAVTQTSITIPIRNGKLGLGTWQGLYLWEHRKAPHSRKLVVTVYF